MSESKSFHRTVTASLKAERSAADLASAAKARVQTEQAVTAQSVKMGELRLALANLLDCIDYTASPPNCRTNEMVGAVLDRGVIARARKALA